MENITYNMFKMQLKTLACVAEYFLRVIALFLWTKTFNIMSNRLLNMKASFYCA